MYLSYCMGNDVLGAFFALINNRVQIIKNDKLSYYI